MPFLPLSLFAHKSSQLPTSNARCRRAAGTTETLHWKPWVAISGRRMQTTRIWSFIVASLFKHLKGFCARPGRINSSCITILMRLMMKTVIAVALLLMAFSLVHYPTGMSLPPQVAGLGGHRGHHLALQWFSWGHVEVNAGVCASGLINVLYLSSLQEYSVKARSPPCIMVHLRDCMLVCPLSPARLSKEVWPLTQPQVSNDSSVGTCDKISWTCKLPMKCSRTPSLPS